jgi:hypothetical protein
MFKNKDASAEIAASMESHLVTHAVEKQQEHINKFAKALDYLNSVAEIFDELGLQKEAEATTTFLEAIAAKKSKKHKSKKNKKSSRSKSKKTDPAMRGLTSKKMLDNLANKGWVFNADDDFAKDHHDGCMCSMCMDFNDDYDMGYPVDRNNGDDVEDPDELYEGDFDLPEYNEDQYDRFSDELPHQKGRIHRDDPYASGGIGDRYEDFANFEDELSVDDDEYLHHKHTMLPPPGKIKREPHIPEHLLPREERPTIPEIPIARRSRR